MSGTSWTGGKKAWGKKRQPGCSTPNNRELAATPVERGGLLGLDLVGQSGKLTCLDPFGGVDGQAVNDGADQDTGAVGWCLDDEALKLSVARVLPFGVICTRSPTRRGLGAVLLHGILHGL